MNNKQITTNSKADTLQLIKNLVTEYDNCDTLSKAINSDAPSIITIPKQDVIKFIYGKLIFLSEYIAAKLSEPVLLELSKDMYKKIYLFKFPEISILFDYLKEQKYYEKSAGEVLQYVNRFQDDRFNLAEKQSIEHHENLKHQRNDSNRIEEDRKLSEIHSDYIRKKMEI